LEHVEVLQRKFDEFQKDMAAQEFRVTEVLELADRLVKDGHPEVDTINRRKEVFKITYLFNEFTLIESLFCLFTGT
jgi:spectrin alpha